ncbi:carbon-nitrogen hydrolase family protein [Paenibacillus donghaensis]|uniref:CN hydrolase domain-containing protein n=1 Tax=Paenibacillus donghaensis TaxID=414771 RepID=A0A2Z2KPQ3_9BACL|nr:carbon-nitrogen hydrolase family protein [Paenibacillus donghaensis]ASA25740.1 hypothetical protein B9T62_36450 [Paenibacillus donghaensis]
MVNVGMVQLNINTYKQEEFFNKCEIYIEECSRNNVQLVCFPECFNYQLELGNSLNNQFDSEDSKECIDFILKMARKYKLYIVCGTLISENSKLYNTAIVVSPEGELLGMHKKINLTFFEKEIITAGENVHCYETHVGKIGLLLGNDINSFTICQKLLDENVEVLICLVQIPSEFSDSYLSIVKARTIDLDCFIVVASGCGIKDNTNLTFKGISNVYSNPHLSGNNKLFEMDHGKDAFFEGVVYGNYDLESFRNKRNQVYRPNKITIS